MNFHFHYDQPLPSGTAAMMQIVHTAASLSGLGVQTRITAEAVDTGWRSFYGVGRDHRLCVAAMNTNTAAAHFAAGCRASPDRLHVIVGRGLSGLALFEALARQRLPENALKLLDFHRPCDADHDDPVLRERERRVCRRVDAIACISPGARDELLARYAPACPVAVIAGGTRWEPHLPSSAPVRDIDILYAGKLRRRKGVFDLVAAMQWLAGHTLTLAGGSDAERETLRGHANALGVADRIHLAGFVPPASMPALYRRARAGVCPLPLGVSAISDRYTCPMKVLDMMANGTPIVATDVPSVRGLIRHGETAILAPPNEPGALAQALRRVLENDSLAARLAAKARQEAQRYDWSERARRLIDFAASAHAGPAPRAAGRKIPNENHEVTPRAPVSHQLTNRQPLAHAPGVELHRTACCHVLFRMDSLEQVSFLDDIGVLIWSLCDEPCTIAEMVGILCEALDADAGVVERDITEFVGGMLSRGAMIAVGAEVE